ncbi:MAG: class I SAM-dependent RNA methyltransferase [Clostridia bacterium]|nr:class I SAM-dependent RNA methyltransferase [Clostridia bacterium]
MSGINLIATSTFGLEAIVKRELIALGFNDLKVSDGKVEFTANEEAIPKTNIWLRCADRVLLKMGEFKALSFEELFENTKALPWDEWITEDGKFTVIGKSVKSKLFSVPDCQSIVKKAVVEKLKSKYKKQWFDETGPEFTIQVSILKDVATLTIDTSGIGLHKRGYRQKSVRAPLKETLAAAMIQLSFWNKDRLLLDPFCGSGTIPIEAALIGMNIAPGLNRHFASENWPRIDSKVWKKVKTEAFGLIDSNVDLNISASDIDQKAIELASQNAINAGVDYCIDFKTKSVFDLDVNNEYGVLISNPPYGERIGKKSEIEKIYKTLGKKFRSKDTWSVYLLTSDESFENIYGKKADRKRKLYNGRIKVDYYQYYGKKPNDQN